MQFLKRTRTALCCFALTPLVLIGIGREIMLTRTPPRDAALLQEISLRETPLRESLTGEFSLRGTVSLDAPLAQDTARDEAPSLPSTHAAAGLADMPATPALPARLPAPAPAATTAKFFTINEVLAKRAAQNNTAQPIRLAAIDPSLPIVSDAPPLSPAPHGNDPFGLSLFRAPEGLLWRKWRAVQQQMESEIATIEACRRAAAECDSNAARQFLTLAGAARAVEGRARLTEVNRSINTSIRYTTDLVQHGTPDYWSAPLDTLASGRGDCEDYAIAKYAVLREAGVALSDMKIVLLRDNLRREDHAILAVMSEGEWMVLDNHLQFPVAARELTHYAARYALDDGGVSLFASPYAENHMPKTAEVAMSASGDFTRVALRPSM